MSKKIAHLETVTLDTKLAASKQLNADEILANGEDVAEMFSREQTYREMTTRVKLQPEDNYILYGNDGKVVSANLSGVQNGTRLFSNQAKLTEIPLSWKLDSITDGTSMCESCTNLTSFLHPLNNLSNGSEMFNGCNLNEVSIENILLSLPEYTSGTHSLTLNMSADAFEKFNEITRNIATTPETISYKGWEIASNAIVTLPVGYRKVEYLEGTGTQWIDTEVKLSSESEVRCKYELITETPDANQYLFGAQTKVNDIFMQFGYTAYAKLNPTRVYAYVRTTSSVNNILVRPENGKISVILNKEGLKLNETFSSHSIVAENFELPINCYLFADNSYNHEGLFFYGRIYRFSISRNGQLQCNLIPCLDDTDTPCMYDTVSHITFYNLGASEEEGGKDFLVPTESTTYSLRRTIPNWGKLTRHGLRRLYRVPEDYTGELLDYALTNGFKPIIEPKMPKEGSWAPRWTETEEEIILVWDNTSNAIVEEELTNV